MTYRKIEISADTLSFEELPKQNSSRWLSLDDFQGEFWIDVPNAIGRYKISNYGRLKRIYMSERISIVSYDSTGYPKYNYAIIDCNNKTKQFKISIHRLVGISFYHITNCEYDHIDGNKNNFIIYNLKPCTHLENVNNKSSKLKQVNAKKNKKQRNLKEIDTNASSTDVFIGYPETVGTLRFYTNVSYKEEIWKPIPGYDFIQAEASNYGRIRRYSKQYKQYIICSQTKHGNYFQVNINNKPEYVHRIILLAFDYEHKDNYVDHINSNSKDNVLSNLKWVNTHKENMNNKNTIQKTHNKHKFTYYINLYDGYTGKLYKTFTSVIDVLVFLNIKSFSYYVPYISSQRTVQKYLITKTHIDQKIPENIEIKLSKPRCIAQYTLNGKYIKSYKSMKDIPFKHKGNIWRSFEDINKNVLGFKWKKVQDINPQPDLIL